MMMRTHHMMDNQSATFWGKKCMMNCHHISKLISHQWHFPIKQNCHHGYIKVVDCHTRLSPTEQKNIAWGYADIKQVLLQTDTFKGSFRTEFLLPPEWHQSNILIYQKIPLTSDWMVWILIRKWEDFPDVTLVKRPFFCGSPKNSSKLLWGITQIWWTCWCEMEMSFLNLELLPSVNSSASIPLTR